MQNLWQELILSSTASTSKWQQDQAEATTSQLNRNNEIGTLLTNLLQQINQTRTLSTAGHKLSQLEQAAASQIFHLSQRCIQISKHLSKMRQAAHHIPWTYHAHQKIRKIMRPNLQAQPRSYGASSISTSTSHRCSSENMWGDKQLQYSMQYATQHRRQLSHHIFICTY